jgi:hypothetical protein
VGFEPTIPAFEPVKTVHALERAASVTGGGAIHSAIYVLPARNTEHASLSRIGYHGNYNGFRVEVGSNTSTVPLRVVGDDKKGSFESESVKYGREYHGTRTRE